jgi:hypothetical protein
MEAYLMRMDDEVVRLLTTFVLELKRPSWKRMAHSISANPLPGKQEANISPQNEEDFSYIKSL